MTINEPEMVSDTSIDITPNRAGTIRFARMLLKQSEKEAEVGRKILAEYGLTE